MWATEPCRRRAGLPALALLLAAGAQAQPAPAVGEADIERARRQQPQVTERDIEDARRRHRTPSDAELRRIPAPSTPRIDALPAPATRDTVDLGALARGFDAGAQPPALATAPQPRLLVFISLSMPEATLTRLADQAARARAVLVLRGLAEGSMTRTVARVRQLVGTRQVAVQVDPQAFDRYAVVSVPTFVLVRAGASSPPCAGSLCSGGDTFAKAAGDVSLGYALARLGSAAPAFAADAGRVLERLGGKP